MGAKGGRKGRDDRWYCSREGGSGRAGNRGDVGERERRLARGDTANADRSLRPSLPCPPSCVAVLARPTLRHTSDATSYLFILTPHSSPPSPLTPVSDCTVPCSYMVHPGYAYPSTLLWVDLSFNKVGPCQSFWFQVCLKLVCQHGAPARAGRRAEQDGMAQRRAVYRARLRV